MRACMLSTAVLLSALATGCSTSKSTENAAYCESVKPGTVTSVNHYCALMADHPVNPKVTTQWNGQTVGFCCEDCIAGWAELTEQQKADALKVAVAKGKPSA